MGKDKKEKRRKRQITNLRIMSKIGLLFVIIGFFLPISCNLNGFQIAKAVETFGGPNIISISLYSVFIFSIVGLILLFLLLAKKKFSISNDWAVLITVIVSFSIFIFFQREEAEGSFLDVLYRLQSGAHIIFMGLSISLVFLIAASSIKKINEEDSKKYEDNSTKAVKTNAIEEVIDDTKEINLDSISEYEYMFDSNGKKIEMIITTFNNKGKTESYSKSKYNSNEKITIARTFNKNGELKYTFKNEYDSNGNLTLSKTYNEKGKLKSYTKQEYDSNGNEIKSKIYNEKGFLEHFYIYKYDTNGKLTKLIDYDEKSNLKNYTVYEYDSNGNETKSKTYNDKRELTYYNEIEYDSNGNKTKHINYNEKGDLSYIWEWEYDSNGNITRNQIKHFMTGV